MTCLFFVFQPMSYRKHQHKHGLFSLNLTLSWPVTSKRSDLNLPSSHKLGFRCLSHWNWQEKKQVCCEVFSWRVQICSRDPLACGEERRKRSHSPNQLSSRRSHPAAINASVYTPTSCCSIISLHFSILPSLLFSTVKLVTQHTLVRWTKFHVHCLRRKHADDHSFARN